MKPFASVTREVRKSLSGSVFGTCQDKMSLPFLAALAAAALTPRHSGAIAQRHSFSSAVRPLQAAAARPGPLSIGEEFSDVSIREDP